MFENFFLSLPLSVNLLLIIGSLYIITRASHNLVDGAVFFAHEWNVSLLIIGATVVAMGTSLTEVEENTGVKVLVLGNQDG